MPFKPRLARQRSSSDISGTPKKTSRSYLTSSTSRRNRSQHSKMRRIHSRDNYPARRLVSDVHSCWLGLLIDSGTETSKARELLQDERNKIERLEGMIGRLEDELSRLNTEVSHKDKSISSLQFEKAALSANVERMKTTELSKSLKRQPQDPFAHMYQNFTNPRMR